MMAVEKIAPGWKAQLDLGFATDGVRTRLVSRRHVGPLVVQRPFYPEGDVCHLYIVHPPGGVAGGDHLELNATAAADTHALITTPAATKFYRSAGPLAVQRQHVDVHAGKFEWLPQENIFFENSAVRLETRIRLSGGARFIGWEVACYGRPASGETLGGGRVMQSFELWKDGMPLLIDRLRLDGAHDMMRARWGLAGHAALGALLAYPATEDDLAEVRSLLPPDVLIGSTRVDGVLACRGMAAQAEVLKKAFVRIWQHLRPRVLGRVAVSPRIWST